MAGLLDLILGGSQGQSLPDPSSFGPASDSSSPSGDDVVVQASRRPQTQTPSANAAPLTQGLQAPDTNMDMGTLQSPQAPSLNYDNSRAVAAVQAANSASPAQGGSANPGLYGLLPSNLQHGTLRNVLGALGDAFLVQAGHDPEYANNMSRQASGNAIAGMDMNDPQSVQAATQRLAATGSPDAMKQADQLQSQAENMQMRKAQMDYNNIQRQQMNQIRYSGQYQNIGQKASGQIATATGATYPALYAQLDRRVKQLDPNMDAASALDIPAPEDFQEGALAHYGQSGNNVQQSADRERGQDLGVQNTNTRAGAVVTAANIGANQRGNSSAAATAKPTDATIMQGLIDKQNRGEALSPAEQQWFTSKTPPPSRGRGNRPALIGGGAPVANHAPQGGSPVVTNRDVSYLKSHPEARAQFEAHFGKGAAAKYLGH